MTKSNSCICLFPLFPFSETSKTALSGQINKEDSTLLYSILYENYSEVLNEIKDNCNVIYTLHEKDNEGISSELKEKISDVFLINSLNINSEFKNLNDKYFKKYHNNLIIFSHSIGVTPSDIKKIFSLLEIEDESVMLGRDNDERIVLLGFNSFNEDLFGNIIEDRNHYNEMLIKAGKEENFVHTLSNYMLIETKNDFIKLYSELSKKESLQYCTQHMHEKFTHLFIEYKDLLK
ncbi:MAG TPA: hypothetical protein VLB50_04690 [Ignavibacteriaceae bacterium]|nr:hypothetical protein [Ignavibacteriaceae bacterium]